MPKLNKQQTYVLAYTGGLVLGAINVWAGGAILFMMIVLGAVDGDLLKKSA